MAHLLGNLFILSAPSGAGKSSLIKALLEKYSTNNTPLQVSVSHTTRAPRPGETNGEHYHFVDRAKFEALIQQGVFFEWAEVFGNYYGTSRVTIEQTLAAGVDVFLDIDWQGARQVKEQLPQANSIFILPPSKSVLQQRLEGRGQDSADVIAQRMNKAVAEMSHYHEFDYVLINDDFSTALTELHAIVVSHRCSQDNQAARYNALIHELIGKNPS